MPYTQFDLHDLCKYPAIFKLPALNLATTGAIVLGGTTLGPYYGMNRMVILAVVFDNPSSTYASATVTLGQSSGSQNDFLTATAMPASIIGSPYVVFPPAAAPNGVYSGQTLFDVNVTIAGAGTCTVTVYGSVK